LDNSDKTEMTPFPVRCLGTARTVGDFGDTALDVDVVRRQRVGLADRFPGGVTVPLVEAGVGQIIPRRRKGGGERHGLFEDLKSIRFPARLPQRVGVGEMKFAVVGEPGRRGPPMAQGILFLWGKSV